MRKKVTYWMQGDALPCVDPIYPHKQIRKLSLNVSWLSSTDCKTLRRMIISPRIHSLPSFKLHSRQLVSCTWKFKDGTFRSLTEQSLGRILEINSQILCIPQRTQLADWGDPRMPPQRHPVRGCTVARTVSGESFLTLSVHGRQGQDYGPLFVGQPQ